MNDDKILIVLTTMPDDDRAEALAASLVEARLAACVNLHAPMRSIYRWNGEVARDGERQVVIKTTLARLAALEARVRAAHPYELPEWIVVAPDEVSAEYRRWVLAETSDDGRTR